VQVYHTKKRMLVINDKFLEVHKWFKNEEQWRRFLEDPRVLVPVKGRVVVLVLALPQLVLEKKEAYVTNGRLYIPKEILKKISKGTWVAELVIKIVKGEPR